MLKKGILLLFICVSFGLQAQRTFRGADLSDVGYIKDDGSVLDEAKKTVGRFKDGGVVTGKGGVTIGYIKQDGVIEDESHKKVGTVKSDGTVLDADGKTIGFIKEGTVSNQNNETVGYAVDIPASWAAVYFFFLF